MREVIVVVGGVALFVVTLPITVGLLYAAMQVGNFVLGLVGLVLLIGFIPAVLFTTFVTPVMDWYVNRDRPKLTFEEMNDEQVLEYWPRSFRAADIRRQRRNRLDWERGRQRSSTSTQS